jgi:hypothetical protein
VKLAWFASGRFQYPGTTMGPLIQSSPRVPGDNTLPPSSTTPIVGNSAAHPGAAFTPDVLQRLVELKNGIVDMSGSNSPVVTRGEIKADEMGRRRHQERQKNGVSRRS